MSNPQPTTEDAIKMTERTLQIVLVVFAVLLALIVLMAVSVMAVVVLKDGNNQLVSEAFDKLALIGIAGFASLTIMVTGRAVVLSFFKGLLPPGTPSA